MNLLPQVFMYFALAVLGLALPAIATTWLARHGIRAVREAARRLRTMPLALRMAVACFVAVLVVRGSTKTYSSPLLGALRPILANAPRTVSDSDIAQGFQLVCVSTNTATDYAMPNGADEYAPWRLRGAADDWFRLDFGGWSFPIGTNVHSSFVVFTDGTIRPALRSTNDAVVAVGRQMSAIPGEARFWHSCGTNHSRLLTWEHFAEGRHPVGADYPPTYLSAQLELCGSGDFVVRSNEVETAYRHIEPFDWDGDGICNEDDPAPFSCDGDFYGQTAEHRAAVDAAVGCGELNGLYRFTATFHEGLCRRTLLRVGGERIVVREPGSYSFLLAKGVDYEFETEPFTTNVTYTMADDISPFPLLQSQMLYGFGWWSLETGEKMIIRQLDGMPGRCMWTPMFYGSPDVGHVFPDYETRFEAVLLDYAFNPTNVAYRWESEDANIVIESPNGIETAVTFGDIPRWRESVLTATAQIGTNTLQSHLWFTYGEEEDPQPRLDVEAPEVVFVNETLNPDRYYPVRVSLDSPKYSAEASVELSCDNQVYARFKDGDASDDPMRAVDFDLQAGRGHEKSSKDLQMACIEIGSGTMTATCDIEGREPLTQEHHFEVIEPLQELVCTEQSPNGAFYNPSCLVMGTNACLKVGCIGNFSSNDVEWAISGPGRIVATNGFEVVVEPTALYEGDIIVEARFGHDAVVQPRFALPVRERRRIPVSVCIAPKSDGTPSTTVESINERISFANKVFSQVGVEFYWEGTPLFVANQSFAVVSVGNLATNTYGNIGNTRCISPQVQELFNCMPSTNTVRLFFVDQLINGSSLAFSVHEIDKCCVYSSDPDATSSVFPHELGHILGLDDIYSEVPGHEVEKLHDGYLHVGANAFHNQYYDWSDFDTIGFYRSDESLNTIIQKLLMSGFDRGGADIPFGSVRGLPVNAESGSDDCFIGVGAERIESNEEL